MGRPALDLKGKIIGRLTVLSRIVTTDNKNSKWKCLCKCGSTVIVSGGNLSYHNTQSCGCLGPEVTSKINKARITHRASNTGAYRSWASMRNRCNDDAHQSYKYYGGRGISVCERWNKFENFLEDMGQPPEGYQIDRIDNNKGYYKENCKWSSRKEQRRNRRDCK